MIDWNHIKQLENDIGMEDFQEVVDAFLDEVDAAIAELEDGFSFEPEIQEEKMHFLKGCAFNLGFATMAEFCCSAEQQAKSGVLVDCAPVIEAYTSSREEFLASSASFCSYAA